MKCSDHVGYYEQMYAECMLCFRDQAEIHREGGEIPMTAVRETERLTSCVQYLLICPVHCTHRKEGGP